MSATAASRSILIGAIVLVTGAFATSSAEKPDSSYYVPGFANPAAVYCTEMGYTYKIVDGPRGQRGICVFSDESECDAWDFLKGKCGQEYSYCAKLGYNVETRTDLNDSFSRECAVCVSGQGEVIGPVTELIGLSAKCERRCADMFRFEGKGQVGPLSLGLETPASFDWRNHAGTNWMTSVKDQGACGSCWAFSAVGQVEAMHNIRQNNPDMDLDLSEQYLVSDCFTHESCCGGMPYWALQYIKEEGIPDAGVRKPATTIPAELAAM
jgi:putative hemolysin